MKFVPLFRPQDSYTSNLVRGLLSEGGIGFRLLERGVSPVAFGMPADSSLAMVGHEIQVEEGQLERAKTLLCEHDIVCDVSERLRKRCFESIARPLLRGEDERLDRLTSYLRVNNKATVRAILEDIAGDPGGAVLIERLFFRLLEGEEQVSLFRLASFLQDRPISGLADAVRSRLPGLEDTERRNLADALGRMPSIDPGAILVGLLEDADPSVREAAIEALFTLTAQDLGYEPDASVADREKAVERWRGFLGLD